MQFNSIVLARRLLNSGLSKCNYPAQHPGTQHLILLQVDHWTAVCHQQQWPFWFNVATFEWSIVSELHYFDRVYCGAFLSCISQKCMWNLMVDPYCYFCSSESVSGCVVASHKVHQELVAQKGRLKHVEKHLILLVHIPQKCCLRVNMTEVKKSSDLTLSASAQHTHT